MCNIRIIEGRPLDGDGEDIFAYGGTVHGANVALAETEVKGRPALVLDAGQTVAKVYAAFLFEIPSDYAGTEQVALIDDRLVVRPRGTTGNRAKAIEAAAGDC